MPRGRPRKIRPIETVQKLSVDERQNLKEEVQEREEILKNVDGLDYSIQDSGKMATELNRKRMILDRDEDLIARGKEKDRILKEMHEIEERIVKDRPTTTEMNLRLGSEESQRAVEKNLRFHRLHGHELARLQDLRKRLEPDDGHAQSLEYLRPDVYEKRKTFIV